MFGNLLSFGTLMRKHFKNLILCGAASLKHAILSTYTDICIQMESVVLRDSVNGKTYLHYSI